MILTEPRSKKYATVEIPVLEQRSITGVAGRTIKADGKIIELDKDAIFDRDLVETRYPKLRGKTFTLPNVDVGDIIEYRYKNDRVASHMRLFIQRELPIWAVTYHPADRRYAVVTEPRP